MGRRLRNTREVSPASLKALEQRPEKGNVAGVNVGFNISHPAPPKVGDPQANGAIRYTVDETRRQVLIVEEMLMQGGGERTVIEHASRQLSVGKTRIRVLIQRVLEKWAEEDAHTRARNKSSAIRRYHRYIREARGIDPRTGERTGKTNFAAIAKFEELLSRVQGTQEPLEINVSQTHTEAMLAVIAEMSGEELVQMVEEGKAWEAAHKALGGKTG